MSLLSWIFLAMLAWLAWGAAVALLGPSARYLRDHWRGLFAGQLIVWAVKIDPKASFHLMEHGALALWMAKQNRNR